MSAYLIVNIAEVTDAATYAEYRERVSPGLKEAGGRYLARGGEIAVLEGDWRPNRLVVVEFSNREAALAWWRSAGYSALKDLRQASTRTEMVLVDGLEKEQTP